MSDQSLFDKYGGFSNISKVVMTFYDAVLDSDEIGPFFDDIDMAKMVDHQTKFVASLLGGPAAYTDGQLRTMHARLDITHDHFDELLVILREALEKHGVEDNDILAVVSEYEQRRSVIVG
ncbi:MAG: group I truncated hemoglobin [Rhizobiaceae bacterium]